MILIFNLLSICALIAPGARAQEAAIADTTTFTTVVSPDGAITFTLTAENGRLAYSVRYRNAPVIEPSSLGLVLNVKTYAETATLGKAEKYSANEKYQTRGVHSMGLNRYKGAVIPVGTPQAPFHVNVRVFDDGVAFRYQVEAGTKVTVEKDLTTFVLPAGSAVWSQPDVQTYEGDYSKKAAEAFKAGELLGPPATIVLPANAGYAAITEAALTDFAGMALVADGKRGFRAELAGEAAKGGKVVTPWRVLLLGKDLNTLVNSDIISSLSTPFSWKLFPNAYNTRWVKPGRSVWSKLAGRGPVTLENMKYFTDLAATLGYEYNLVDEGWGHWKDGERDSWAMLKELVDYATQKKVRIWVWKSYSDRRGLPGLKEAAQRKAFFSKCKELGIAGIKIEFFEPERESQEVVRFCQAALKEAAEHQLMLSFYGAGKPTGETRSWPNEMARDAIRGLEKNPPWALAHVTLPFTRMLAGHAGYTPVHFGDRLGEISWAHHIASMAVFSSPFLCIAADPNSIIQNPAVRMMQRMPTTWDETIVLPQSRIGEQVVYARRKGTTWYLAVMNGENEAKEMKLNLSFLKSGTYTLHAVKDDSTKQESVVLESTKATPWTPLTLQLNPYGGFIGRFEKVVVARPAPVAAPATDPAQAPAARPTLPPALPPAQKKE